MIVASTLLVLAVPPCTASAEPERNASSEVSIAQVAPGRIRPAARHVRIAVTPRPNTVAKDTLRKMAEDAATAHTLPVGYFLRLIRQESGFDPNSVSRAGAQGIAQFMPATA